LDKSQYFYRTVVFTRKDNKISLANIDNPNETTELEAWLGTVVSLADGKHTLHELVNFMRGQYQFVPANLEETISSVIERLLEGKMIQLSEKPVELPYYLASPVEELDLERARALIKEDGYTFH